MIYIENTSNNCFFNHALEEYYMNKFDDDIFILWINSKSILLGRNQNLYKEINLNFIEENNIKVVRRSSGGGCVYNGDGNINFTFITKRQGENNKEIANNFYDFTKPVIECLKSLRINAEFTGRNDILINGKKFSGNAQFYTKSKILHHGTLMFDLDLDEVSKALITRNEKIKDKSISSVSSRVTNIKPHLGMEFKDMTTVEFKEYLKSYIMKYHGIEKVYIPSDDEIKDIELFSKEKYESNSWTYGKCPKFNKSNVKKYPFGLVEYDLFVEDGRIKNINIGGDYFFEAPIYLLESKLIGTYFTKEAISIILEGISINKYIFGMDSKTFIKDLLE